MPRTFPNEIFDIIIASIAKKGWLSPDNRQTLLNCTFVCRDWLQVPASRHALLSDVRLTTPAAWDSFLRWVVSSEAGRPRLKSIHRLNFTDKWFNSRVDGKDIADVGMERAVRGTRPCRSPSQPRSLSLRVNWMQCPPHPSTFGMFSQFTSLRELRLWTCRFPSFSTFRRILVSLPALESLSCSLDESPSAPQASILTIPSKRTALKALNMALHCPSFTLAVLEWLIHTPTRSTLVDLDLHLIQLPSAHRITLPNRTFNYYAQTFAPSLRKATFGWIQSTTYNISLDSFANLEFLGFIVDGTNWLGVADFLRPLPAHLDTLVIFVRDKDEVVGKDLLMKEDGEVKAMRTNGLEHLDTVLSLDSFKDLRCLQFRVVRSGDTLDSIRGLRFMPFSGNYPHCIAVLA